MKNQPDRYQFKEQSAVRGSALRQKIVLKSDEKMVSLLTKLRAMSVSVGHVVISHGSRSGSLKY